MRLNSNAYVYMIIMCVMIFVVLWSSLMMKSFEAMLLPSLIGTVVFVLAAIGLMREVVNKSGHEHTATKHVESRADQAKEKWQGYLLNGAWLAGFILSIYLLGFMICIPIFVLSYMKWLGARWTVAIVWGILAPAVIYGGFEVGLGIDLHRGLLLASFSQ